MRILTLTVGERVTHDSLYKSQVLDLSSAFSSLNASCGVISVLPIFNVDSLKQSPFEYLHYLSQIKAYSLSNLNVDLRILYMPVSSHFRYIQHPIYRYFWSSFVFLYFLKNQFAKCKPSLIHCRGPIAALAALKCRKIFNLNFLVNFDARGNLPLEVLMTPLNSNKYLQQAFELEKYLLKQSDFVSIVSPNCISHDLQKEFLPKSKIIRIASLPLKINSSKIISSTSSDFISVLFIGSLSSNRYISYPFSELSRVYWSLKSIFNSVHLHVLAPIQNHNAINTNSNLYNVPLASLNTFQSLTEISHYSEFCDFGVLPYASPSPENPLSANLAATIIGSKISDYFQLGLIPIVPAWCTSLTHLLSTFKVGLVYDNNYEFNFSYDSNDITSMRRKIRKYSSSFTTLNIAESLLEYWSFPA